MTPFPACCSADVRRGARLCPRGCRFSAGGAQVLPVFHFFTQLRGAPLARRPIWRHAGGSHDTPEAAEGLETMQIMHGRRLGSLTLFTLGSVFSIACGAPPRPAELAVDDA